MIHISSIMRTQLCICVTSALLLLVVVPAAAADAYDVDEPGGSPRDEEVLRRAAIDAITRGDRTTALTRFKEALQSWTSSSHSVRPWYVRLQKAQVLAAIGEHKRALKEFKRVAVANSGQHAPEQLQAAGFRQLLLIMRCHQSIVADPW